MSRKRISKRDRDYFVFGDFGEDWQRGYDQRPDVEKLIEAYTGLHNVVTEDVARMRKRTR
jgi:hypothetical protein